MEDKISVYSEDDYLLLSGIQHFVYCERQWALIHVENQWVENFHTAEGRLLHQRVDDPCFMESRGDIKITRSVPLVSKTLGLYGIADVIELHKDIDNQIGMRFNIVEYKRGKPKPDDRDEAQLCAQALCLEEMIGITLNIGYIYYGKIRHRHKVIFDHILRSRVQKLAKRMHQLYIEGKTPPAVISERCNNCSLIETCLPRLGKDEDMVEKYYADIFAELLKE
jgi:CRISPR-associated exonuclease Cas4